MWHSGFTIGWRRIVSGIILGLVALACRSAASSGTRFETLRLDAGTRRSPVEPGFRFLGRTTLFTPTRGYGWFAPNYLAFDRNVSGTSALTRDGVVVRGKNTLAVQVTPGTYELSVYLGDMAPREHRPGQFVVANGVRVAWGVATRGGEVAVFSASIRAPKGVVLILFDGKGPQRYCSVVGIELRRTAALPRGDIEGIEIPLSERQRELLTRLEAVKRVYERACQLFGAAEAEDARLIHPRVSLALVGDYMAIARENVYLRHLDAATKQIVYLEKEAQAVLSDLEEILEEIAARPEARLPRPLNLRVGRGTFLAHGVPVRIVGTMSSRAVREMERIARYGFNAIFIPARPWADRSLNLPHAQARRLVSMLNRARDAGLAAMLSMDMYRLAEWVYDGAHPAFAGHLDRCARRNKGFCIEFRHPTKPDIYDFLAAWLDAVVPALKGHPALLCYCVGAEMEMLERCRYTAEHFREWAIRRHRNIEGINRAWGTRLKSLDEITPKYLSGVINRPTSRACYDFLLYSRERALRFFKWIHDRIRLHDPNALVNVQSSSGPYASRYGLNYCHNPAVNALMELPSGRTAAKYSPKAFYKLFRGSLLTRDFWLSLAPGKPQVNLEFHVYSDLNSNPPAFLRTQLWAASLHGAGADLFWRWWRADPGTLDDGLFADDPAQLAAVAHTAIELQGLEPAIRVFRTQSSPVRMLYSLASHVYDMDKGFREKLGDLYEALNFMGIPIRFVTELQVTRSAAFRDVKLLVISHQRYITDAAYRAIERFVREGGVAVVTEGSLAYDEYKRGPRRVFYGSVSKPMLLAPVSSDMRTRSSRQRRAHDSRVSPVVVGSGRVYVLDADLDAWDYHRAFQAIFRAEASQLAELAPPVVVALRRNKASWRVEWRAVTCENELLMYLINFNQIPVTVHIRVRSARHRAARFTDLTTGEPVGRTLTLLPLMPVLLGTSGLARHLPAPGTMLPARHLHAKPTPGTLAPTSKEQSTIGSRKPVEILAVARVVPYEGRYAGDFPGTKGVKVLVAGRRPPALGSVAVRLSRIELIDADKIFPAEYLPYIGDPDVTFQDGQDGAYLFRVVFWNPGGAAAKGSFRPGKSYRFRASVEFLKSEGGVQKVVQTVTVEGSVKVVNDE